MGTMSVVAQFSTPEALDFRVPYHRPGRIVGFRSQGLRLKDKFAHFFLVADTECCLLSISTYRPLYPTPFAACLPARESGTILDAYKILRKGSALSHGHSKSRSCCPEASSPVHLASHGAATIDSVAGVSFQTTRFRSTVRRISARDLHLTTRLCDRRLHREDLIKIWVSMQKCPASFKAIQALNPPTLGGVLQPRNAGGGGGVGGGG